MCYTLLGEAHSKIFYKMYVDGALVRRMCVTIETLRDVKFNPDIISLQKESLYRARAW